ncbi:hypothetical protein PIB30_084211 [Stylosanthes scabra]|uniref:Uncharacterized protein n=1 Tax=Stylosanthes scabra TaxID=79078 RepID=A0ABU6YRI2_9FABA|nr:hypothetical protein [Stylosanthes scabra]
MSPIEVTNIGCVCLDARWRDGNRVYALSLAFRVIHEMKITGMMRPLGREVERNGIDPKSTPSSKPYELFRIESSRLVPEPIRFHPDFTFNVRKALRVDSSSSESIPKRSVRGVKRLDAQPTATVDHRE